MLDFYRLYKKAERGEIQQVPPHPNMEAHFNKLRRYFAAYANPHKLRVITNEIHRGDYEQALKWMHKITNPDAQAKLRQYREECVKHGYTNLPEGHTSGDPLEDLRDIELDDDDHVHEQRRSKAESQQARSPVSVITEQLNDMIKENAQLREQLKNNPNYKQDYKDACKLINDLRSQLNTANQKLSTTSHKLKSAAARADRQQERADKLAQQLKDAQPDDKWQEKYYDLEWEHAKLKNDYTAYKSGLNINYNDAMKAILTGAVVDTNSFAITGADKLKDNDWADIAILDGKLEQAKKEINIWLWDITHVPPGRIGERYKGKSYNPDMGAYLHHIDGMVHSAYQMIEATQDYIIRGKRVAGK